MEVENVRFDSNVVHTMEQSVLLANTEFENAASTVIAGCGGAVLVASTSPYHTALVLDRVSFHKNQGECTHPLSIMPLM